MNEITKLYDAIHMPPALEASILAHAPVRKPRFRPAVLAAVLLVLVCLLGCSPAVQEAVGEWVTITFDSLDLKIYKKEPEAGTGQARGAIVAVDTNSSTFAFAENGRLYFTGNGEHKDITDQITEDKPFIYTYQNREYEITLVVGCHGTVENFGTYEFIKENGEWFTGSGRNYLSMEDETAYPWVTVVWDTLNIPWPLPGA